MKKYVISLGIGITGLMVSSIAFDKTLLGVGIAFSSVFVGCLITPALSEGAGNRPPRARKPKTKEAIEHEQWLAYNTYIKKK